MFEEIKILLEERQKTVVSELESKLAKELKYLYNKVE